jgi:hypothetical protein
MRNQTDMADTILTEEQAHDGLLQEYSDAYKSYAGFRPSLSNLHMLGNMELYEKVQDVYARAEDEEERTVAQDKAFAAMEAEARAYEADIAKNGIGPFVEGPLAAALREAL